MNAFDPSAAPESFVTASGLKVGLLALPPGSQAAALVRVAGGAHDAPTRYPGLAHFLEHLLFLGSEAYAVDDSLMAFVQGCSGQLNASTRERHTDFFFQVRQDDFEQALRRLLDMLARPLLDRAAQAREREVLQAEFLARGRDTETLCDAALGTALADPHPFGGFHAGNRETLPVESADFQAALTDYHRRFYNSGALELLVATALPRRDLEQLLQAPQCHVPSASAESTAPRLPRLAFRSDWSRRLQVAHEPSRLLLAYALDEVRGSLDGALDYLACALTSEADGSLIAALRARRWCEGLAMRVPYLHRGQSVVVLDLRLSEQGHAQRPDVVALVSSWLAFFARHGAAAAAWDEYQRVRQRSLVGMEPLLRLRFWIEAGSRMRSPEQLQPALGELLAHMVGTGPTLLTCDERPCPAAGGEGFVLRLADEPLPAATTLPVVDWQLPKANPWLRDPAPNTAQPPLPTALRWLGRDGSDAYGQGALYLSWQFATAPSIALALAVEAALCERRWAARQAGVEILFEDLGTAWSLGLVGFAPALPLIAADLLPRLESLGPASLSEAQARAARACELNGQELLVRQLWNRLPRLLGIADLAAQPGACDPGSLDAAWNEARWQALAFGLGSGQQAALATALAAAPGRSAERPNAPVPVLRARHWWSFGQPGEEAAVVLFCPLPTREVATEAAWRTLAQTMEAPFFRRLRSELQLGYAVLCGFRQFGTQAGMLFVVQSPKASAAEILGHIEAFLAQFAAELPGLARTKSPAEGGAVSSIPLRRRAEQTWQACLAGLDPDHPQQVIEAMARVDRAELARQLQLLRTSQARWQVVSNAASLF